MADAANKLDRTGRDDASQSEGDEQDRISGSRPAARYYEPLPIGAEAFAVPLPKTHSQPPVFSARAKVVSLIVGVAAGVGAGALLLAFVLKPAQPSKSGPLERSSAHDSQSERAIVEESAPVTLPAATEEAAPVRAKEDSIEHVTASPSAAPADPERGDLSPTSDSVASPKSARHSSSHHADRLPAQPDRAEVIATMKAVQPAVRECFGDVHGTVTANMKILGRSGRVTTAQVVGQPGRIGSCVARAVRQARFPKFAAESLTISYPFGR